MAGLYENGGAPTPRTDAAEHRVNYLAEDGERDYMAVVSDFARQLERELAAARLLNEGHQRLATQYRERAEKAEATLTERDAEIVRLAEIAGRSIVDSHPLSTTIARIARRIMESHTGLADVFDYHIDAMRAFAAEEVAKERARCAKVCDDEVTRIEENAKALLKFDADDEARARVLGAAYVREVAATIRAKTIGQEPT